MREAREATIAPPLSRGPGAVSIDPAIPGTVDCLRDECLLARAYTIAMQGAQSLEFVLGTVIVRHRLATSSAFWLRDRDTPTKLARWLHKLIVGEHLHLLIKATASEHRKLMASKGIEVPEELAIQIDEAIGARNYLAHRFLREHSPNRPGFSAIASIRRATELQDKMVLAIEAAHEIGERYGTFVRSTPASGEMVLPRVDALLPIIEDAVDAMTQGLKPCIDDHLLQFAEQAIAIRDRSADRR